MKGEMNSSRTVSVASDAARVASATVTLENMLPPGVPSLYVFRTALGPRRLPDGGSGRGFQGSPQVDRVGAVFVDVARGDSHGLGQHTLLFVAVRQVPDRPTLQEGRFIRPLVGEQTRPRQLRNDLAVG